MKSLQGLKFRTPHARLEIVNASRDHHTMIYSTMPQRFHFIFAFRLFDDDPVQRIYPPQKRSTTTSLVLLGTSTLHDICTQCPQQYNPAVTALHARLVWNALLFLSLAASSNHPTMSPYRTNLMGSLTVGGSIFHRSLIS